MILGMLRVKNESRWIARCLSSLLTFADFVLVMDDHSTDDTLKLAGMFPQVQAIPSPFVGLDEARDKNWLLDRAEAMKPEWIVAIDGDEVFSPTAQAELPAVLKTPVSCLAPRIWYLWNAENQVRIDGVYGDFHRASIFRPDGSRFGRGHGAANFHCGNVPPQIQQRRKVIELDLLHFGYMHREDRVRKYEWYNATDPGNTGENCYMHMVVGDIFPADSKFVHGGPLKVLAI